MPSVLIIGATRGLGVELAKQYVAKDYIVTGTARSDPPKDVPTSINWITGIDVAEESAGRKIVDGLKGQKQDVVIISAGVFHKESYDEPDFDAQVCVAPCRWIARWSNVAFLGADVQDFGNWSNLHCAGVGESWIVDQRLESDTRVFGSGKYHSET